MWKWIGKNKFSIGKNEILNPLGILCIPKNIWPEERPCWLIYLKVKVYITRLLLVYNLQKNSMMNLWWLLDDEFFFHHKWWMRKREKINSSNIFEGFYWHLRKNLKIHKHCWLSITWMLKNWIPYKPLLKTFQKSSYISLVLFEQNL